MGEFVAVARTDDIPLNKGLALEFEGVAILVGNSGGEFVTVENRCSHQDKPLADGRIRNGYIFCPVHGMRFKLDTGEAIGQLTRVPINVYETRVVDGQIEVRLPSGPESL